MRHDLTFSALTACLLFSACAFPQEAPSTVSLSTREVHEPPSIDLDRPLHLIITDGTDRVAPAGSYRVEPTPEAQLRLLSTEHAPIPIAADHLTHDIDLSAPFALVFAEEADQPHVLLLMPDGRALDAIGSVSGIRPPTRNGSRVIINFCLKPGRQGSAMASRTPQIRPNLRPSRHHLEQQPEPPAWPGQEAS